MHYHERFPWQCSVKKASYRTTHIMWKHLCKKIYPRGWKFRRIFTNIWGKWREGNFYFLPYTCLWYLKCFYCKYESDWTIKKNTNLGKENTCTKDIHSKIKCIFIFSIMLFLNLLCLEFYIMWHIIYTF